MPRRSRSSAAALDHTYEYAWDVLGSARFVQDDAEGALNAWNHAARPQIDSLVIDGLSRTRYCGGRRGRRAHSRTRC